MGKRRARLDGKTAIITGATGGIGETTVARFLDEGANVVAVGRSEEKLEEMYGRLESRGNLVVFIAEATDEAANERAVKSTIEHFGQLDILFANAGTEGRGAPIEQMPIEDFRHVLDVNVTGVWISMKHAAGAMRQAGGGSMIATSSIAGLVGMPMMSHYFASKHAVIGLVKSAALELAEAKIRVNAVAPGPIDNRMMQSLTEMMSPDDPGAVRDQLSGTVPLQRFGQNDEVASLVTFLASDESQYITGTVIPIDGGYVAQ